jgi:AcrR family transcriptional regulator
MSLFQRWSRQKYEQSSGSGTRLSFGLDERGLGVNRVENSRNIPRQRRSRASVEVVLEAATQVLEARGESGFNTNAVAERAGVSIGTLYRYFPDKQAILAELARREMAAVNAATVLALAGAPGGMAADRAAIHAFLHAFGGRVKARRSVIVALLAHADPMELAAGFAPADANLADARGRPLSRIAAFVLTRAIHGAMRAAVVEGVDFILAREFEDELVRLGRAYLGFPPPKRLAASS